MSVHHSSLRLQRDQLSPSSHGSRTSLSIDTQPKNAHNAASLGSFRKLSPGRKLKMAIQSGTKAFSPKSDSMIYAAGMSPEHAYHRSLRHDRSTWRHGKHKPSITSLAIKENPTFAFKEKTFVCMQIPNLDESDRIVFLRIGHTGQLLMVPYPLELSEDAYQTDPIYSFYDSEGDNPKVLSQKLHRVRKVLEGLDKMGSSVWSPIGLLVIETNLMAHTRIQTEYEGRTYNFQLRNMEDKTELYNRVRFEMQLSQRTAELLEPPCEEDAQVHLDILINAAQAHIQEQKAILEAIEQRLGADMHDISKYTKELESLDSSLPSLEQKIDRANQIISSKDRLESCKSESYTLFRQLTAITQAMKRREQKMSRYGSWLTTLQVRVDVIKMATRNSGIWKQFRPWIACKFALDTF